MIELCYHLPSTIITISSSTTISSHQTFHLPSLIIYHHIIYHHLPSHHLPSSSHLCFFKEGGFIGRRWWKIRISYNKTCHFTAYILNLTNPLHSRSCAIIPSPIIPCCVGVVKGAFQWIWRWSHLGHKFIHSTLDLILRLITNKDCWGGWSDWWFRTKSLLIY